jgi:NTE family protein
MNRPTERLEAADRLQRRADRADLPGQVVLVLQGGGALGSYQAGVYQGLQEAAIEPDWIIGTSIGAINASLIAGNEPQRRLDVEPQQVVLGQAEAADRWFGL